MNRRPPKPTLKAIKLAFDAFAPTDAHGVVTAKMPQKAKRIKREDDDLDGIGGTDGGDEK